MPMPRKKFWTEFEDQYLKENYSKKSVALIAEKLNRPKQWIRERAANLKLRSVHFWTKEDLRFLKNNYGTLSIIDLIKKLNRSKSSIITKARKLKLKSYKKLWIIDDEQYLKENYSSGNLVEIAKKLNRTKKAIIERAKILHLQRNKEATEKVSRKYSINKTFFDTWTKESAYVLGLMCSDGNISKDLKSFSICLHKNDAYLLHNVLKAMKSTHPVRFEKNKNMASFRIHEPYMCNKLISFGVIPNKSLVLKCPDVPKEFIIDFIRGEMDGDGSVSKNRTKFKICTASVDFANGLSKLFDKINIIHKVCYDPYWYKGQKRAFYNIRILKKQSIFDFCKLAYNNANDLYMLRKKERFINMGAFEPDFYKLNKHNYSPVIATNILTKQRLYFESIKSVTLMNFIRVKVIGCCRKRQNQHHGYTFRYATEDEKTKYGKLIKSKQINFIEIPEPTQCQ